MQFVFKMASLANLQMYLDKNNLLFEDFYKDFFNDKIDSSVLEEELYAALKKSVNSLRFWGKRFDSIHDSNRLLFTTFSPNVSARPSVLEILKAVAKIFDIARIKEVYLPENRNYLGLEFHNQDDLEFVKANFKIFDDIYIVYVHWLAEAKLYLGKIHWLPSSVELNKVGEIISKYFIIHDLKKDKMLVDKQSYVTTNVIIFSGLLRVGIALNNVPHMLEFGNCNSLLTIKGRKPLCLKCKKVGHVRNECPYQYCTTCRMELVKTHSCQLFSEISSYANITKSVKVNDVDNYDESNQNSDKSGVMVGDNDEPQWIEVKRNNPKSFGKRFPRTKEVVDPQLSSVISEKLEISRPPEDLHHQGSNASESVSTSLPTNSHIHILKRKLSVEQEDEESHKIGNLARSDEDSASISSNLSVNMYEVLASEDS